MGDEKKPTAEPGTVRISKATRLQAITFTALMTALVCVIAPFSVPLPGEVPLSLANLMLLLAACLLGGRWGTMCAVLYLLVGMVGVPVFSGFGAGLGKLLGPTGGYLIGYVPMVMLAGCFVRSNRARWGVRLLGLLLGIVADYLIGTLWFCHVTGTGVSAALPACILPFLPGDILKALLLCYVAPKVRGAVEKAGHKLP